VGGTRYNSVEQYRAQQKARELHLADYETILCIKFVIS